MCGRVFTKSLRSMTPPSAPMVISVIFPGISLGAQSRPCFHACTRLRLRKRAARATSSTLAGYPVAAGVHNHVKTLSGLIQPSAFSRRKMHLTGRKEASSKKTGVESQVGKFDTCKLLFRGNACFPLVVVTSVSTINSCFRACPYDHAAHRYAANGEERAKPDLFCCCFCLRLDW